MNLRPWPGPCSGKAWVSWSLPGWSSRGRAAGSHQTAETWTNVFTDDPKKIFLLGIYVENYVVNIRYPTNCMIIQYQGILYWNKSSLFWYRLEFIPILDWPKSGWSDIRYQNFLFSIFHFKFRLWFTFMVIFMFVIVFLFVFMFVFISH